MRILLVLTCCLALTAALGAQDPDENKGKKKKAEQTKQQATGKVIRDNQSGKAAPGRKFQTLSNSSKIQGKGSPGGTAPSGTPAGRKSSSVMLQNSKPEELKGRNSGHATEKWKGPSLNAKANADAKMWHAQNFKLANKPNPSIQNVKFIPNHRIEGSQNWQGSNYAAFRNYRCEWHERDWWRSHHSRIVFVFGGWYFWDANYWYPAWGYDSNAYYAYDGPIYAYHDLDPGQVVANVQASLQRQGYYHGMIDGMLGPLTRAALARYQQDRGLAITMAIDGPTLYSLGMS
jgi:hypothetical protein